MNILDWLASFWAWVNSPEGNRAVAGTLGGVVISLFNWEGVFLAARKIFVGTSMAYAIGPTGVLLFNRGLRMIGIGEMPDNAEFATAFLIGVFGMVIIETVLRVIRAYRASTGSKR